MDVSVLSLYLRGAYLTPCTSFLPRRPALRPSVSSPSSIRVQYLPTKAQFAPSRRQPIASICGLDQTVLFRARSIVEARAEHSHPFHLMPLGAAIGARSICRIRHARRPFGARLGPSLAIPNCPPHPRPIRPHRSHSIPGGSLAPARARCSRPCLPSLGPRTAMATVHTRCTPPSTGSACTRRSDLMAHPRPLHDCSHPTAGAG
jgi:hypothetical protein